MTATEQQTFFVVGGNLEADAPSYVTRQADQELQQAVLIGEYCNVLTTRQMGKSSLMVRTVNHLKSQGIRAVTIDLTVMGTSASAINASEWYFGLISQFKRQLRLRVNEIAWWNEHQQLGPVQRFSDFLRQVVLTEVQEPIIVFIDEIDTTLALPFTDDFFAAIRAVYNARASDPVYNHLTFVLFGVARPTDLIKDRTRTPYNIGSSIDLRDFIAEEAQTLLTGLQAVHSQQAETILTRILYWTDGHPYLTQKVCAEVITRDGEWTNERIDRLIEQLFLAGGIEARKETNLQFIRERIRESQERAEMLRVYRRVRAGKRVKDEERSVIKSQLKLTGLIKTTPKGELVVRNRIYGQVFDNQWIRENMPRSRAQWLAIIATIVALLAVLIVGYLFYINQTRSDTVKAELFITGFRSATSPEVRLNNLAGLFRLKGYETQAHDLFFELNTVQRLAMFVGLNNPQQVGSDILTVVEGVYQDQRLNNNPEHNQLLQAMAEILRQIGDGVVPGAQLRAKEIEYWMAGRDKATQGDFTAAIEQYTLALGLNESNSAVLLDRGIAYTALKNYEQAVTDLQGVVNLDQSRAEKVKEIINGDEGLFTYVGLHHSEVGAIAAWFPTLTSTATSTPIPPTLTPADTPTPTNTATSTPTSTSTPTLTPMATPTLTPTLEPRSTFTPTPAPLGIFNSFESSATWKRGDQPNGTFEQSTAQVYHGSYAGKLTYNFPSSGNDYVVFLWPHPLGGEVNQITAWVYGDGSGHFLNIWIKDNEGEIWQFTFGQVKHTGWQEMNAYLDPNQNWPVTHIGGPSNGVLDYPISFWALVLDDIPDTYIGSGTIYIDDLTAGLDIRTPTPTPPPSSIDFRADRPTLNSGECAVLRWDVENVREVYMQGAPVVGHGSQKVCPSITTTFVLHVVLIGGSTTDRTVAITVK